MTSKYSIEGVFSRGMELNTSLLADQASWMATLQAVLCQGLEGNFAKTATAFGQYIDLQHRRKDVLDLMEHLRVQPSNLRVLVEFVKSNHDDESSADMLACLPRAIADIVGLMICFDGPRNLEALAKIFASLGMTETDHADELSYFRSLMVFGLRVAKLVSSYLAIVSVSRSSIALCNQAKCCVQFPLQYRDVDSQKGPFEGVILGDSGFVVAVDRPTY